MWCLCLKSVSLFVPFVRNNKKHILPGQKVTISTKSGYYSEIWYE